MPVARALAPSMVESRRRAMGSDCHLVVVEREAGGHGDELVAAGWARIDELEARWSRFREGSEVSALNRDAGKPMLVSDDTIELVRRALSAWELTGGRCDPTVGAALVTHGYDRDFDALVARGTLAPGPTDPGPLPAVPAPGLDGIAVDPWSNVVTLPAGVMFDPGGIGKGLAADLVAAALVGSGAAGALVNLGGDLRALGVPPAATGWTISVPDPVRSGDELIRFALPHGAVATTSRLRRRWSIPTGEVRHLIDPATGRPAETDVVAVTVVADEAWRAEALTKLLFLAGPGGLIDHEDIHAVMVTADGARHTTPGLTRALR